MTNKFEETKLQIVSLFTKIGIPFIFVFIFINFLTEKSFYNYLLATGWAVILSISYMLIKKGQGETAKYFIAIVGAVYMSLIYYLFGLSIRCESMYALFILSALYFFPKRTAYTLVAMTAVLYLGITALSVKYVPPLDGLMTKAGALGYTLYSLTMIGVMVVVVMKSNKEQHVSLKRSFELLEDKNEELERFNHIVSHDLKEPLRSMISFSNLLEKNEIDLEKRKFYLRQIAESGERLGGLLDGFRTFQSVSAMELDKEEIDLVQLFNEILASLSLFVKENNVTVKIGNLPKVNSSRSGLTIILKNLTENAVKFKSDKPIIIDITGEYRGDEIFIYIRDNGIGVPEAHWEKIFNLFQRLDNDVEGSGVGLSISKKTALKLNGDLKITESSASTGTTFLLILDNNL